jgi:hypothetical protein
MSPATTKVSNAISAADFDRIAANMRQCSIIHATTASPAGYQLRLNPALTLLFVTPCGVSPIEP